MYKRLFIVTFLYVCVSLVGSGSSSGVENGRKRGTDSSHSIASVPSTDSSDTAHKVRIRDTKSSRYSENGSDRSRVLSNHPPNSKSYVCPPMAPTCPECVASPQDIRENICVYTIVLKVLLIASPQIDSSGRMCGKFGLLSTHRNTSDKEYRRLLRFSLMDNCTCQLKASQHYFLLTDESLFLKKNHLYHQVSLAENSLLVFVDMYSEVEIRRLLDDCSSLTTTPSPPESSNSTSDTEDHPTSDPEDELQPRIASKPDTPHRGFQPRTSEVLHQTYTYGHYSRVNTSTTAPLDPFDPNDIYYSPDNETHPPYKPLPVPVDVPLTPPIAQPTSPPPLKVTYAPPPSYPPSPPPPPPPPAYPPSIPPSPLPTYPPSPPPTYQPPPPTPPPPPPTYSPPPPPLYQPPSRALPPVQPPLLFPPYAFPPLPPYGMPPPFYSIPPPPPLPRSPLSSLFTPDFAECLELPSCPQTCVPIDGGADFVKAYCDADYALLTAVTLPDRYLLHAGAQYPLGGVCLKFRAKILKDVSKGVGPKDFRLDLSILLSSSCDCFSFVKGPKIVLLLGMFEPIPSSSDYQLSRNHDLFLLPAPSSISLPVCAPHAPSYPAASVHYAPFRVSSRPLVVQDLVSNASIPYPAPTCPYGMHEACPECLAALDQWIVPLYCSAQFAIVAEPDISAYSVSYSFPITTVTATTIDLTKKTVITISTPPKNLCIQGSLKIIQPIILPWGSYSPPGNVLPFITLAECPCPFLTTGYGQRLLVFSSEAPSFLSNGALQLSKDIYVVPIPIYAPLPNCASIYIHEHIPDEIPSFPELFPPEPEKTYPQTPELTPEDFDYTPDPPLEVSTPAPPPPPKVYTPAPPPPPKVYTPAPPPPPVYTPAPPPPPPPKVYTPAPPPPPKVYTPPPPPKVYTPAPPPPPKVYTPAPPPPPKVYTPVPPPPPKVYTPASPPLPVYTPAPPTPPKVYTPAPPPPPVYTPAPPPPPPPVYTPAPPPPPPPVYTPAPPPPPPPVYTPAPPPPPPPVYTPAPPPPPPPPVYTPVPPPPPPPVYTPAPPPPPPPVYTPAPPPPPVYTPAPPPPPVYIPEPKTHLDPIAKVPPPPALQTCPLPVRTCPVCSPVLPQNFKDFYCLSSFAAVIAIGLDFKVLKREKEDPRIMPFIPAEKPDLSFIYDSSKYVYNLTVTPEKTAKKISHDSYGDGCYKEKVRGIQEISKLYKPFEILTNLEIYIPEECKCETLDLSPAFGVLMSLTRPPDLDQPLQLTDHFVLFPLPQVQTVIPFCDPAVPPPSQPGPLLSSISYGALKAHSGCGESPCFDDCDDLPCEEACDILPPGLTVPCDAKAAVLIEILETSAGPYVAPTLTISEHAMGYYESTTSFWIHVKPNDPYKEPSIHVNKEPLVKSCKYLKAKVILDISPIPSLAKGDVISIIAGPSCNHKLFLQANGYAVLISKVSLSPNAEIPLAGNILKCLPTGISLLTLCPSKPPPPTVYTTPIPNPYKPSPVTYVPSTEKPYVPPTSPPVYPPSPAPYIPSTGKPYVPPTSPPVYPPSPAPYIPSTVKPYVPPTSPPVYPPSPKPTTSVPPYPPSPKPTTGLPLYPLPPKPYVPPTSPPVYPPSPKPTTSVPLYPPSPKPTTGLLLYPLPPKPYVPPISPPSPDPPVPVPVPSDPGCPGVLDNSCPICLDSNALDLAPAPYCKAELALMLKSTGKFIETSPSCIRSDMFSLYDVTADRGASKVILAVNVHLPTRCIQDCPALDGEGFILALFPNGNPPQKTPLSFQLTSATHLVLMKPGKLSLPGCKDPETALPRSGVVKEVELQVTPLEWRSLMKEEDDPDECPQPFHSCPECQPLSDDRLEKLICSTEEVFVVSTEEQSIGLKPPANNKVSLIQTAADDFTAHITIDNYKHEDVCTQPLKKGTCNASLTRYYYDTEYNSCEKFKYKGCDGNGNNFETEVECEQVCKKYDNCKKGRLTVLETFATTFQDEKLTEVDYAVPDHCDCSYLLSSKRSGYLMYNSSAEQFSDVIQLTKEYHLVPLTREQANKNFKCAKENEEGDYEEPDPGSENNPEDVTDENADTNPDDEKDYDENDNFESRAKKDEKEGSKEEVQENSKSTSSTTKPSERKWSLFG